MTKPQHRAMVQRTNVRNTSYWAAIGPWRSTIEAACKDADAHRLETNPVAQIRIYTLSSETYNGYR